MSAELTAKEGAFADQLFAILKEEHFRDPLLDAIRAGSMSREGLKLWARQAVLVVKAFTGFISAIHSNCPDREAQSLLAENLWEEHGRGVNAQDHFVLFRRLARSMGVTDQEISESTPLPETTLYIDHCSKLSREGSFVESMTGIGIGIEHFMPKFFGSLARALEENYGLTSVDLEYLLIHVDADADHARRSLEVIQRFADTDEVRERAKRALRETLAVKRRFAEAVYRSASSI